MDETKNSSAEGAQHTLNIHIDTRSGRIFGKAESQSQSPSIQGVERGIFKSIASISDKEKDVAKKIDLAVEASDHMSAAEIALGDEAQVSLFFAPGQHIFQAIKKIDRSDLSEATQRDLLKKIVGLGLKLGIHGPVYFEIKELLDTDFEIEERLKTSLQNVLALAELERGSPETAIRRWKELLNTNQVIDAGQRAWIYRNLALALRDRGDIHSLKPAENYLTDSCDAFLESGHKADAAHSLKLTAELYEARSLDAVVQKYDEILEILKGRGVFDDEIRANFLHSKGRKLLQAKRHTEAKDAALEAAKLRDNIIGMEEERISSLHLARIAAEVDGDKSTIQFCNSEIGNLEDENPSDHFSLGNRISDLLKGEDIENAQSILTEAKNSNSLELYAGASAAIILADKSIDETARLEKFELLHHELEQAKSHPETLEVARLAIATCLSKLEDHQGAARWYKKIVDERPLNISAGHRLIDAYWRAEDWGEAVLAAQEQIDRFGEAPGYLYVLGKSQFEAGDMNGAVTSLTKSIGFHDNEPELAIAATELREEALKLGGTIRAVPQPVQVNNVVSLSEVKQALSDFGSFISAKKRMTFWQRPKGDKAHKWSPSPEKHGQNLLHSFLQARFGDKSQILEEIGIGAGRLDILAQFSGGLTVIVELKMCGSGYSSSYAGNAEAQVQHYMKNNNTNIGFVVAFDARKRENGKTLLANDDQYGSIFEILIDMRPTVVI